MKAGKLKYIISGIVIVAVMVWIIGSISSENLTYYYTPEEVFENLDTIQSKKIRVMGFVQKGSVKWTPREIKLEFQISEKADRFLTVEYLGTKPDMFREGQGVVVEGKMISPRLFKASALLVKHSEEYKLTEHDGKKDAYYKTLQQ